MGGTRVQSSVERLVRARHAENPDGVWLKFEDREYAWRDVISLSQRIANGLLDLGVRPGERVAIMAGNKPEFLWVYFGLLMIGAHVVPLNRWQRGPALLHMLTDSASTAVVFDDELADVVLPLRSSCPALRHTVTFAGQAGGADATYAQLATGDDREPPIDVARPSDAVGLLYTSGTTGPPKGIFISRYEDLLGPLLDASEVKPGETMYVCLPLIHGNALLVSTIGSIRLRAKVALAERFSASRFWDDCRKFGAVHISTLGGIIPLLMKQPVRRDDRDNPVRIALSVGCPAAAWRPFEERFGVRIVEWYGMSDSPGNLINTEGRVGSMGRPVDGAEFRVVDKDDRTLPPRAIGELLFRHPAGPITSYNNMPEATAAAYRGGWFHSGDLAEMDDDGFFYFRGRMKEAIRRRGENVSAWEVESVIDQYPGVRESAAFGVPSEVGDEEVMIVVVLQPGATVRPEELLEFCQGRLAYYALPRFVEIVDSLPKTGTQKVQKNILKERGRTERTWDREQSGFAVRRR